MNNQEKIISRSNLSVYLFFAIITICKSFDLSSENIIYLSLYIFGFSLLIARFFVLKYRLKEIILSLILVVLGVLILLYNHNNTPLFFFIALISLKGMDLRRILKVVFFVHLISFLLMIMLSVSGIITNEAILHCRSTMGCTNRYGFGYRHPNLAQMHLCSIILNYFYVFKTPKKILSCVAWGIASAILYVFTISRTSFAISEIFLIYELFMSRSVRINRMLAFLGRYSFIILSTITLVLTINFGHPLVRRVDDYLTGRVYYQYDIYKNKKITPFGNNDFNGDYIDNSYFGLLYSDGYIVYALALISSLYFNKKIYKKSEYEKLIFVLFFNMFCFTEKFYLLPVFNFTTLFYADELFKPRKK